MVSKMRKSEVKNHREKYEKNESDGRGKKSRMNDGIKRREKVQPP